MHLIDRRADQVSLAWLLSRPAVASAIVGAETVEDVAANATAADVKLEQAPTRRPNDRQPPRPRPRPAYQSAY
jgi:aryl-alcohol dehydrogenase-like predicted oxidoreductase